MIFTRLVALCLATGVFTLSAACGQTEPIEPETELGEDLEEPAEEELEDELEEEDEED